MLPTYPPRYIEIQPRLPSFPSLRPSLPKGIMDKFNSFINKFRIKPMDVGKMWKDFQTELGRHVGGTGRRPAGDVALPPSVWQDPNVVRDEQGQPVLLAATSSPQASSVSGTTKTTKTQAPSKTAQAKSATFEDALKFILEGSPEGGWEGEGGYVNHPADKGGPTNHGITQATYDAYRASKGLKKQDVRYITNSEVKEIYFNNYWKTARCDRLPSPLNMVIMDIAVHSGPGQAIRLLQRALNALGIRDKDGKPLVEGDWGPKTESAVKRLQERLAQDPHILTQVVNKVLDLREEFFKSIVKNDPSQEIFLQGWLNRNNALRKEVQKYLPQ
jgi:lysozyme family protein